MFSQTKRSAWMRASCRATTKKGDGIQTKSKSLKSTRRDLLGRTYMLGIRSRTFSSEVIQKEKKAGGRKNPE